MTVLLTLKFISLEVLYYFYTMNFEKLSLISLMILSKVSYWNIVHCRENGLNFFFLPLKQDRKDQTLSCTYLVAGILISE